MSNSRRFVQVPVSGGLLQDIFTLGWSAGEDGVYRCIEGLPAGAEFISAYSRQMDPSDRTSPWTVFMIFGHESFDEVPMGLDAPVLNVRISWEAKQT